MRKNIERYPPVVFFRTETRDCLRCHKPFQTNGDFVCPGCNGENKKTSKRDRKKKPYRQYVPERPDTQ